MGLKLAMVTSFGVRCGIATYSANLAPALAELGVDVRIVRMPRFGKKRMGTFDNVIGKIPTDIDLISVQHEYGIWQTAEERFYKQLKTLGKPIVTTMHSIGNWEYDGLICEWSDRIIVHNLFCARKLGFPCTVIPHGAEIITDMPPRTDARKRMGIDLEQPIVGYVGFITSVKGLEVLVEAMEKLPYLLLIGGGYYHTEPTVGYIAKLRQHTEKVLGKRCVWTGYVPDYDLARVYSAIDILVYPSRYATESGALIMALSHGKAVIASDLAPFREKGEALMTFKDAEDLGNKIKQLVENPEARRYLERKARGYSEKNSWAEIAKKHLVLFEDVLEKPKEVSRYG